MESKTRTLGKSLKVPIVQELAKDKLSSIPSRYIRHDKDQLPPPDLSAKSEIPVIDMQKLYDPDSGESELLKLHKACIQWGFFQLINHGADPPTIETMKSEIQGFFNLPMEQKNQFCQPDGEVEGYGQIFVVSDEQKLDWADLFFAHTLPMHYRKPDLIPNLPASFREAIDAYSAELKKLAMKILNFMAKALGMKAEEMDALFAEGMQSMRMNYYPPCPEPELVKALKTESHRVVIYEKSDKVGGTWVYDPEVESDPLSLEPNRDIVHSSLYHSLRTNLPRQLMGFPDYPFCTRQNRDPRTFPGHQEVLQFLNEFATKFELLELIRFKSEVIRVERFNHSKDRWIVESSNVESTTNLEEVYDAVVVCNGHYTVPSVADFPGREKWPGKQIHSHNYRVPDPFKDQIVVVIGDGPSALDISLEIADVAKEVHLSSRSPNVQVSKLDFLDNMWQHSKIDHANEKGEVVFQDGAAIHADIILHCTGFMYSFPFLKTDGIVTLEEGRVGPLYKHIFPPKLAPNLSFLGLAYRTIAMQMIDFQAKWVAHILSGRARLPSMEEMEAEVQRHYQYMEEKGTPKHHTHSLNFEMEYLDWLGNEAGVGGVDETSLSFLKKFLQFVLSGEGKWRHKDWEPRESIDKHEEYGLHYLSLKD